MIVVMYGSYCDIYFVLHFTAPWSVQLKFTCLIYILRCLQHYSQQTAHTVLPTIVLFCFNSDKAELLITADTSLLMKSIKGTTSDFKMRSRHSNLKYCTYFVVQTHPTVSLSIQLFLYMNEFKNMLCEFYKM